jgi:hypothetical protein
MTQFLFVFLFVVFSLSADSSETKAGIYGKISRVEQTSATARNAVLLPNTRIVNNSLRGALDYNHNLCAGKFKGQGVELGFKNGKSMFVGNLFFDYSELKSDCGNYLNFYDYSLAARMGNDTFLLNENRVSMVPFNQNSLRLINVGYTANLYLFKGRKIPVLEYFSLKFGGQLKHDSSKIQSNHSYGASNLSLVSTAASPVSIHNPLSINIFDEYNIRNVEYGIEFIAGLSFLVPIAERHFLGLGLDYLHGPGRGIYSNKNRSPGLSPFIPGTPILYQNKLSGKTEVVFSGARFSFGYSYQTNDNFAIRLSYTNSQVEHRLKNTKVKWSSKDAASLLAGNYIGYAASSANGFGPNPSSKDNQSRFSLEFIYSY